MANTHSLDLEASSSQYASITDASQTGLDITGDITIEAWIKLESDSSSYSIVSKQDGSENGYALTYQGGSNDRFVFGVSGTNKLSYTTLSTETWYHIASVYDASAGTNDIYVNGVALTRMTGLPTSITDTTADFKFGKSTYDGYFDGLIDEVRVWNDIRTVTEIADNYERELVGNEANLQGYWRLNNNYLDETSNNNDLTASGSPVFSTDVPFTTANTGAFFAFF